MSKLSAVTGLCRRSPAFLALLVCTLGFGIDQAQLQMGGALAAIFSASPYSLGPQKLSWLLSAIYVGGCIGAPLLGRAADYRGQRKVLSWTLALLGVTSLLSCLRDDPTWLTAFRLLLGVSMGAYPPIMIAYLTSLAPDGQRGKWIFWVCGLAYIAGPVSLVALRSLTDLHPVGLAGWRWLSASDGAIALIAAYLFRYLPDPMKPQAEVSRPADAGLLTRTSLRRTFAFVALLYALYPWGTLAFSLLMGPILLQRGFTLNNTLWYLSFATAWPAVGTLAFSWVIDRIPRRTALLFCCVGMLIGVMCFFAANTELLLGIALVVYGLSNALYPSTLTTFGAECFPSSVRATATSAAWAMNRAACLLVPLAILPLENSLGPASAAACISGALISSIWLTLRFSPGLPRLQSGHALSVSR